MFKIVRIFLLIMLAAVVPAAAGELTDSQKDELSAFIREYLMKNPEVLRDALQELDRRQAQADNAARKSALTAKAAAVFRQNGDLVGGNRDGKITVVEFFDYNCGYCRKAFPDVMKMIGQDKDIRLVMKEFPILGPGSTYAARAALAAVANEDTITPQERAFMSSVAEHCADALARARLYDDARRMERRLQ
jgi:protein-disulfide isomerase